MEEKVRESLKKVIDPELGLNIVDLGLIYKITIENNAVTVRYTLTSPGCPLAPIIDQMMRSNLSDLDFENIILELVWDPPWIPEMMSEESRIELGFD